MSGAVVVIPARWGSVRFPGKALTELLGRPLIQHTWERCQASERADRVIIATDDPRIANTAINFGAEVAMTSSEHLTGSDRLAEVAANLRDSDHVINVQGDEPTISPELIDLLIEKIEADPKLEMVTAATPFADLETARDPNNVKVVADLAGDAMYFSRSLIPFDRDGGSKLVPLHHLGIYGYRREFLLQFVKWKPTPLETAEKLEQLRALENGARIHVVTTQSRSVGVDTPEDVPAAEAALRSLRCR